MKVEVISIIISVVAFIGSGFNLIYKKGMKDKDLLKTVEGIKKSRLKCREDRSDCIQQIENRLSVLENNNTKHDLIILEIRKDLEQISEKITDHHSTTQLMITQLTEHQQEMNKALLETLRGSIVKN